MLTWHLRPNILKTCSLSFELNTKLYALTFEGIAGALWDSWGRILFPFLSNQLRICIIFLITNQSDIFKDKIKAKQTTIFPYKIINFNIFKRLLKFSESFKSIICNEMTKSLFSTEFIKKENWNCVTTTATTFESESRKHI